MSTSEREILVTLLKTLLDEKLTPIEKRTTREIKDLETFKTHMKTIDKNVESCNKMTERIIEKLKQKAEEEKKKKEAMMHKRSQSTGGHLKTQGGAGKRMIRNKTEANLRPKTAVKPRTSGNAKTVHKMERSKTVGNLHSPRNNTAKKDHLNNTTPNIKHRQPQNSNTTAKHKMVHSVTEGDVLKKKRESASAKKTMNRNATQGKLHTKKEDKKPEHTKPEHTKKEEHSKKEDEKKSEDKHKEPAAAKTEDKKEEKPKEPEESKVEEKPKESEPIKAEEPKEAEPIKVEEKEEAKKGSKNEKVNKAIEKNINLIGEFLSANERFNMCKLTRPIMLSFLFEVRKKKDNEIKEAEKEINDLKTKHSKEELEKEIGPFVLGKGPVKAIGMLNEPNYSKFFEKKEVPDSELLLVYKILFQLLGNKEVLSAKDDKEFWDKICNLFLIDSKGKLGDFVTEMIKNLNFSNENIQVLTKMCKPYLKILTPVNYSKKCATTGLFIFMVKEALEYAGIIRDKKVSYARIYKNDMYVIEKETEQIKKIDTLLEKLKK